jgi:hypothetical protein
MGADGPNVAIRSNAHGAAVSKLFDLSSIPPRLLARDAAVAPTASPRRSKIWEFSTHLHCSIIGTCLSVGELRNILRKLGLVTQGRSDHELHSTAVTLAGRHDDAARQLNKALDHRHRLTVHRFARTTDEAGLRALWAEAVRCGEIPGAYWATLTHPASTHAVVRDAFGDVHMMSHLIGSANRADIRRLCQLENERAALTVKLDRQQNALHEAVVTRDAQIADLRRALTHRIMTESSNATMEEGAALRDLVGALERRVAHEAGRRASMDEKIAMARAELFRERAARVAAEQDRDALRRELDAIEAAWSPGCSDQPGATGQPPWLDGVVLLYVGGRPNQIVPMRAAAERAGAAFLHHDGGVEHHSNLLAGLVSRSSIVLFPVDCISHDAASAVKLLCRQGGKRFVPLRSASVTSLLAALHSPDMMTLSMEAG